MGRGGSRLGAGRPGCHCKAEHCPSIDVRRWARKGYLTPGTCFGWQWTCGGEHIGSLWITARGGYLLLRYSYNGEPESERPVTLARTPCHYGGARVWFQCPHCWRNAAKLYLGGGRFACRICYRLTYAVQSEDALGRAWRKQAKLEAKIGPNWTRPKGMHATTFERTKGRIIDCEMRCGDLFNLMMSRFMGLL